MEFESDPQSMSTITYAVPDQATFERLIDVADLPECTLEVAETRELVDQYLDTPAQQLRAVGSTLRLATVGEHHFLIYLQRRHPNTLLASTREIVERLSTDELAAQLAGDQAHPLYATVARDVPGELSIQLVRRSTFQSKLFRVGETRFELGLEAVVYSGEGKSRAEQLVSLELIEGDPDVLAAIGEHLRNEFDLLPVFVDPFTRGLELVSSRA